MKKIFSQPHSFLIASLFSSMLITGCVPNQVFESKEKPKLIAQVKKIDSKQEPATTTDITDDKLQLALPEDTFHPIVWDEMRQHFDLAHQHFGYYDNYLHFYSKRTRHLEKVSDRAQPYLYYIFNEVKKRDMPYEIALLPVVESGFRPTARSHQRAVGLWQFIPSTGDLFDLHRNWWYDGRKDVVKSTQAALDYLEKLYRLNNNDWLLALASYNAGLGNVYKAQKRYRKKNKKQPGIKAYQPNFWEIQPYLPKETQAYVPKLLAVSHIVEYKELFEVELTPIENEPFFKQIKLDKQVALNQVSKLADTPNNLLAALNPAYHQPATPPKGPHHILLPIDRADQFTASLENNQDIFRIQWQKHKIRSGDSLSVIAQRYKTSSKAIKKLNGMRNAKIRAGKTLLIPIPVDRVIDQPQNTQLAQANTSKTKAKPVNNKKQNSSDKHLHVVKNGDSLWKLARYYNVSTKQLTSWNGISVKKPLKLGQTLVIYSNKYGQKIEHTLKAGESLWTLAKRYKVTTKDIAGWNQISTKKVLQPGMKLTIWTKRSSSTKLAIASEYTVKTGDNLWNIAKANKVSARQLASHNNLSMNSLLKPGQVLKIPTNS